MRIFYRLLYRRSKKTLHFKHNFQTKKMQIFFVSTIKCFYFLKFNYPVILFETHSNIFSKFVSDCTMALCSFVAAHSEDTVIPALLAAKQNINQMIKNNNFDRDLIIKQENIISQAFDRFSSKVQFMLHVTNQIDRLKEFSNLGFAQITAGKLDEDKLKKLCLHLDALHIKIKNISFLVSSPPLPPYFSISFSQTANKICLNFYLQDSPQFLTFF